MKFELVKLDAPVRVCPSALAVTVRKNRVCFRLSAELATECKLTRGALVSLAYDEGSGMLALVADPDNKSGCAAKCLQDANQKSGRVTIEMPRVGLLARVFPEVAGIKSLNLFAKRAPGKVVFHAPDRKDSK